MAASIEDRVAAAYEKYGGNRTVGAHSIGLSRSGFNYWVDKLNLDAKPLVSGQVAALKATGYKLPKTGVKYYLITSAQNNTKIFSPLWNNLLAYKSHLKATMLVGTYTYNKKSYSSLSVKSGSKKSPSDANAWYAPEFHNYFADAQIELAPGLVWCGEMNITPTAQRPLRGFETYNGRQSNIFPHSKIALESIASGKHEHTKFNYTTGTATMMNYLQRGAGLKAEHHHAYGALVVEVDSKGGWWVRQLHADKRGSFYDLDKFISNGAVERSSGVAGITWGDIHTKPWQSPIHDACWGSKGMLETLRPKVQFVNDLLDFRSQNHHDRGNPHRAFAKFIEGLSCVTDELKNCATFLKTIQRRWCRTVVIESNHDQALKRWLAEGDYRHDPQNALFFLRAQVAVYEAIERGEKGFHLLQWAVRREGCSEAVRFLHEDESFTICQGKIECGMHGHRGPNGSKGVPMSLSKLGKKANIGDKHSAQIIDGLYVAGMSGDMDQGYNIGPSSWSPSHIVTYPNGRRAIYTVWHGKWRA